jgi:hypothetical protein
MPHSPHAHADAVAAVDKWLTVSKQKDTLVIELQKQSPQNPVAKFARRVNKAGFFRDRTVYSRKGKHKDCESFLNRYLTIVNQKRFCFTCVFNLINSLSVNQITQ